MRRRGHGAGMIPLAVMAGGALGSVARWGLTLAAAKALGQGFPWGTVLINILGSLVIGWFAGVAARDTVPDALRAFVMTGICGGFTTFSSFSLQTMELLRSGHTGRALANIVASVSLCLMATALGLRLSQS